MPSPSLPIPPAVGIDIGDRHIRVAVLRTAFWPPWRSRARLTAWNEVAVPSEVVEQGRIKDPGSAANLIIESIRTSKPHRIRLRSAVSAVPDTYCFVKSDTFTAPGKDLEKIVRDRATQDFPFPLEETEFRYSIVRAERESALVMFGATPREVVMEMTALLESANLSPFALESESMAISRSVEHLIPEEEPHVILDLSAVRSSLIATHRGAILLTVSLPVGGEAMTERIAERMGVSPEKAEELKRSCGLDPARCETALRPLIADLLRELVSEVRKGIAFVERSLHVHHHPTGIALLGDGANLNKIESVLSRALIRKVRRTDPTAGMSLPADFPRDRSLSFATALGLARLAISPESHKLRL